MERLGLATFGRLPTEIGRPPFDPRTLPIGILHLGLGAFHRAHQAVYTQNAIAAEPGPWGIVGVSLRQASVPEQLEPQGGLYTVAERSDAGEKLTVIGSVRRALNGATDMPRVLDLIAHPATAIVSLTVTEKGYTHDPATGRLDEFHRDIIADRANPEEPRSTLGVLVEGLRRRRDSDAGPVTVLCCDNLPHNGRFLRDLAMDYADFVYPDLWRWIESFAAFPSTMVDRIVPATTDADRREIARRLGLDDLGAVVTEPFKQWVIEDRFVGPRPAWEAAGAQFVGDVAPFEAMKLRLLNGSHSAIAYLGYLAGHEYVHQAVARSDFRRYVELLHGEAASTLAMPPDVDVRAYRNRLIERFSNTAIRHRTWQIAMDGSQKLPQRLLDTARRRLEKGMSVDALALAVAGWMRYAAGRDEKGEAIDVRDPLAPRLKALADANLAPADLAKAFFGVREVFGLDLPTSPFATVTAKALARLFEKGAAATVAEFAQA